MKPGAGWPIGIAIVLAATVVGNLVMMRVAGDDPSMAIEPDYYRKAGLEVCLDCGDEVGDRVKHSSPDGFVGDLAEPAFYEVQPRA